MLVIIGTCVVLNILATFLDASLFPAIAGVILAIVFLYISYLLWDLYTRDDQNFDEYNFSKYTAGYPRANEYNPHKSKYDTYIDVSNCVVRKDSDSYIKL